MLLGLCSGLAVAASLEWSMAVIPQSTLDIELHLQDGPSLFRILSSDNLDRRNFGWRPDLEPKLGTITGNFPTILLGPGNYTLTYHSSEGIKTEPYTTPSTASRFLPVMLPETATGVMAFHHSADGQGLDGFSFASNQGGVAFLPLDNRQDWQASPLATDQVYEPQTIRPEHGSLSFHKKNSLTNRSKQVQKDAWVRFLLFPLTLICFIGAGLAMRRYITNWKPHLLAASAGALTGLYAIQESVMTLSSSIILRGDGYEDPSTSVTLLWSLTESLFRLSENANTFAFPEGHSWLIMGPSWLSYIFVAPICWLTDAIVAHNLGILVFSTLNFYSVWLLARAWGANPLIAGIAALGATLSPAYLSEVDTLSLDRSVLFPIPIFLLCVHHLRTLDEAPLKQQIPAILGGALSLCAALLSQIYYGIYLAAAAPLLILPRLISKNWLIRLRGYMLMGAIGFMLLLPLLLLLKSSTENTVYDKDIMLKDVVDNIFHPIEPSIIKEQLDGIVQTGHRQMATPQDRLISAISNSLYPKDISSPAEYFYGAQFYWLLIILALLISNRRKDIFVSSWDVFIFCLLALGPISKTPENSITNVLPYYFYHLFVPGFEQLKHPYRFIIMASMISTIPIALGFQSMLDRKRQYAKWLTSLILAVGLLLIFVRQAPPTRNIDIHMNMPYLDYIWARFKSLPQFDISLRKPGVPSIKPIPKFSPLTQIAGQPAIIFPFTEPLPVELYLATTRNKIPLLNSPPHGTDPTRQLPSLLEENSVLNQVAWFSGSDRLRRYLSGGVDENLEQLRTLGIHHIIVFPQYLPSSQRWAATEAWLQTHTTLLTSDETVSIWTF